MFGQMRPKWRYLAVMLWYYRKIAVYEQMAENLSELKKCCKEDLLKIPQQRCERLIKVVQKTITASYFQLPMIKVALQA